MSINLLHSKLRWYRSRYGNLTIADAEKRADELEQANVHLKVGSDEYVQNSGTIIALREFANLLSQGEFKLP